MTAPCTENPCNGGSCQYHAGTYICTCLSGLTGEFCEETSKTKNASIIMSNCYIVTTNSPGPETTDGDGLTVTLAIGIGLPLLIVILIVVIVVLVVLKCRMLQTPTKHENIYDEPNNFNDGIYEEMK